MELTAAVDYVRLQSDAETAPAVSDEEITTVLMTCRLADRDGNAPGTDDWAESYWLPRAIAEVLNLRVLRAGMWVDSSTDGTSMSASQAVEALRKQESRWRRRCAAGQ